MGISERIQEIKDWLNEYFSGTDITTGYLIEVYEENNKIVIHPYRQQNVYIREARKGRGIDMRRVVPHFGRYLGKRTIVGKDHGNEETH